ncbi:MAG: 2-hydroxyacid dehydrogenase [Clostridia bacterium]|nr:2-hydroxyacid dehydrogenase [Clostridia bacterium]
MKRIAFFDTKPYEREWFDSLNKNYEITYFETKLRAGTARLAEGFDAVCAFVNDDIDARTIDILLNCGVRILAMRSSGYNNVDFRYASGKLPIVRVPSYSPHAVAEHAMALLLTLNRKTHKAYIRTRDFNFSLAGLTGTDLHGKTAGIIGTGKIGRVFIDICRGFGMTILAYDPYPNKDIPAEYVDKDTLFKRSDFISLHCPLSEQTYHILDKDAFSQMKKGVYIINTSRGALIDSAALLEALNNEKVGGAGLDVYEEEADLFFEDLSGKIIRDDVLSLLVSRPNVIISSHQAFLTKEALENIAAETFNNLDEFFAGKPLTNEVVYKPSSETTNG